MKMTKNTWGRVQDELKATIGKDAYKNWIEPLELVEESKGLIRFAVPTNFFGDWVSRNYGDRILQGFLDDGFPVERLDFTVPTRQASQSAKRTNISASAVATQKAAKATETELPGSKLDKRFTFDGFVVGKPNELAHAAARRVAEGGPVTFNPLFLYGGVGLGKTHL
ncbi:MAG: chromosomal replication initiator protein, partial [Planctomycetota bacterium]